MRMFPVGICSLWLTVQPGASITVFLAMASMPMDSKQGVFRQVYLPLNTDMDILRFQPSSLGFTIKEGIRRVRNTGLPSGPILKRPVSAFIMKLIFWNQAGLNIKEQLMFAALGSGKKWVHPVSKP